MDNKGFYIKAILATGTKVQDSRVDFNKGCNLIHGQSDTGKSVVFSIIQYLLGQEDPPKEATEGKEYDTFYMQICMFFNDEDVYTIQRKLTDKTKVYVKHCSIDQIHDMHIKQEIYSVKSSEKPSSYSSFLLKLCGFDNTIKIKQKDSKFSNLYYTQLRHLLMLGEQRIVDDRSIFLPSGIPSDVTKEKSVISYLYSGEGDPEIDGLEDKKLRKARITGKIEYVQEEIKRLDQTIEDIGDVSFAGLEEALNVNKIKSEIKNAAQRLDILYKQKHTKNEELDKWQSKILFEQELYNRLLLLKSHYELDIERYKGIEEARELLSILTYRECPKCHTKLQTDSFDLEDEQFIAAIEQESFSDQCKLRSLNEYIKEKKAYLKKCKEKIDKLEIENISINNQISETEPRLKSFRDLLKRIELNWEKKTRLKHLEEDSFRLTKELSELKKSLTNKQVLTIPSRNKLPAKEFYDTVKEKMVAWNLENHETIVMNLDDFDFTLGGKRRITCGKGYRGITATAIMMSLVEDCIYRNVPFTRLLVTDSPITAHFGKEDKKTDADDLEENVQRSFFQYMEDKNWNYQLIMMDNKHPYTDQKKIMKNIHFIEFSETGRKGFYVGKRKE